MVYDTIDEKVAFVTSSYTHLEPDLWAMAHYKTSLGDQTGYVQVTYATVKDEW